MRIGTGVPVLGSVPGEAFASIGRAWIEAASIGEVEIINCLDLVPYDKARNFLLGRAVELECDLFWAIDSDCVVPEGAFVELFKTLKDHNAQAVLAHNYMRGYPYMCSWFKIHSGQVLRVDAGSGVHEISNGGLHCCLIDLQWVKEHLEEPYFKYQPYGDVGERIMEDAYFFKKIREAGGLVLGNANVRSGHTYTRVVVCDKTAKFLRTMQREEVDELDGPEVEQLVDLCY